MTGCVILLLILVTILVCELVHTRRRLHEAERDLEYVISGEHNTRPRWLYPRG